MNSGLKGSNMRKVAEIFAGSVVVVSLGMSSAGAVTFDGMDMSPEWTTGITEVRAVTDGGIEVFIPVFSLFECKDDDIFGGPCVWVGSQQGNGVGGSFVLLGPGEGPGNVSATISDASAEILSNGAREPVEQPEKPVQAVRVVEPDGERVEAEKVPGWVFDEIVAARSMGEAVKCEDDFDRTCFVEDKGRTIVWAGSDGKDYVMAE